MPTLTGSTGAIFSTAFGADGALVRILVGTTGAAFDPQFGTSGFLFDEDEATGLQFYIAGINRTEYIGTPSVKILDPLTGTGTCQFLIKDPDSSFRPACGSEVVIYRNAVRIFGGHLQTTRERYEQETCIFIACTCQDYNAVLERRIVGQHYTLFQGGLISITVFQMMSKWLVGEGFTLANGNDPGTILGEQTFNYVTIADAWRQMCNKVGWDYKVDYYKTVWLFPAGTGRGAAPINITDANKVNWGGMEVSDTIAGYANVVYTKNSQNVGATWTDTLVAFDGQTMFETSNILFTAPVVTVNGVDQTVVESASISSGAYDFYYIYSGIGIFRASGSPLSDGDVVTVTFPSVLSYVDKEEDAGEIAARAAVDGGSGRYEIVDEVKDLPDVEALTLNSTGVLARRGQMTKTVQFNTLVDGFYSGQVLTIDTTRPLVPSATYTITKVSSDVQKMRGDDLWKYTVEAVDASTLPKGSLLTTANQIIARDKQPIDRIVQRVMFVLAETIEGITNPGLSVGVKKPVRVATKNGVCRDCVLYFNSVLEEETTADVEVDIFQNGVSIFTGASSPATGTRIIFPAGSTVPASVFQFHSNPLVVTKGDKFTFEVIQADSAAKDGYLELSVWG
jgi:hypothetical protein